MQAALWEQKKVKRLCACESWRNVY